MRIVAERDRHGPSGGRRRLHNGAGRGHQGRQTGVGIQLKRIGQRIAVRIGGVVHAQGRRQGRRLAPIGRW